MTAEDVFMTLFGLGLALASVSAFFPLFPSRTLSPDVIMRRLFWTGAGIAVVFSFLVIWPAWQFGLFVCGCVGLLLLMTAVRYTSHLRFRGRIFAMPENRGPDRPPSRRQRPEL
ncbi:hypothetical protein [Mycobacterium sp. ACS4331]|uniref:hypothetical protein n=1 Tax=Mycobacterium sp. ACS4331 TaxID=1834121 RepID=UPI000834FDBF|nr:hypothetical protein [Mycobacterium sp. ACS4331]